MRLSHWLLPLSLALLSRPLGAQPRPAPRPTARPAAAPAVQLRPYRVQAGDTCVGIATARYRNGARTDLIHAYNPTLGPPPHRLRVGQVLQLPDRVPSASTPLPAAVLTETQNRVEVINDSGTRVGHRNDPLFRGTRVSTLERASAEVTFADETQLRLSEQTLVVILGESNTRVRRLARASDTVLERGTLRAFLGSLGRGAEPEAVTPVAPAAPQRPARRVVRPAPRRARVVAVPIRTASGRVVLRNGEAQVAVGARNETTVAVYSGSANVVAGNRTVTVQPGFAVRAEGNRVEAPHALPVAPQWQTRPPRLTLTDTTAALSARWEPGTAPANRTAPAPATWHIELARDPSFLDLASELRTADATPVWQVEALAPGAYYLRVSAVDAARFEGPFSEPLRVTVVRPEVVAVAAPHRAVINLPGGLRCGLGEEALEATEQRRFEVNRLVAQTLRCSARETPDEVVSWSLAPTSRGPFTVVARFIDADPVARSAALRVQVVDSAGEQLTAEHLRVSADVDSIHIAAPTAGDPSTVSLFAVRWGADAPRSFRYTLTVDGRETVDREALTLPEAPPRPRPRDGVGARVSLRGEALGGRMLSGYQQNTDPSLEQGNTLAMRWGLGAALQFGFDLKHPEPDARALGLATTLSAGGWLFPRPDGDAGRASTYLLGLRGFYQGSSPWRPALDVGAGLTATGAVLRPAFEAAVSLEYQLTPSLSLGPVVRYFQIVQAEQDPFPVDARVLSVGLSLGLRPWASRRSP